MKSLLLLCVVVLANYQTCAAQQQGTKTLLEQILDQDGDGTITKLELTRSVGTHDMIVGAQGNPVQLAANTLFGISTPVENIPYDLYLEFLDNADWVDVDKLFKQLDENGDGKISLLHEIYHHPGMANVILLCRRADKNKDGVIEKSELKQALSEKGRYKNFIQSAIPLCIGDMLVKDDLKYQVIGTTPEYFQIEYRLRKRFEFISGRNIDKEYRQPEHFFEAVIGSEIANRFELKVGDALNPQHGIGPGSYVHETPFKVVGILAPTRTVNDFRAFVNIEGFYNMENHIFYDERPDEAMDNLWKHGPDKDVGDFLKPNGDKNSHVLSSRNTLKVPRELVPLPQREVTVILVKSLPDEFLFNAETLRIAIEEHSNAQVVPPSWLIHGLLEDHELDQLLKMRFPFKTGR